MQPRPLITYAIRDELRESNAAQGRFLRTGIGGEPAAAKLSAAIEQERPSLVLSTGFCGGLNPALKPGAIVVSREYSTERLVDVLLATATALNVDARAGRLVTVRDPVLTAAEKRKLHVETGADAVDMETAELWRVCERYGVPMVAFRAVCDTAEMDVPIPLEVCLDSRTGESRLFATAMYLLAHPGRIAPAMRLAHSARLARQSLGRVVREGLGWCGGT